MRYVQSFSICKKHSILYYTKLAKLHSFAVDNFLLKWICHHLLDHKQCIVSLMVQVQSLLQLCQVFPRCKYWVPCYSYSISTPSHKSLYHWAPSRIYIVYADDLLLYRIIHDQRDFIHLQLDIAQVSDWVNENHLTWNAAKSKAMVISRRRVHSSSGIRLRYVEPAH